MVRTHFTLVLKKGASAGILMLLTTCYQANSQSLSASVSRNPVAVGEQFQLTFTLNATGSNFEGPSLSDFFVLSGPNQSSSVQIINGSISQSQSFTYYLQAKTEGQFKIGSASIISNGKKLESPPFTLTVTKGQPQQSTQQGQPQRQESDGVTGNDVFIRAIVDKTNVYRGEGISITYRLYTRVQLVNYAITKAATLNGFYTQDVPLPAQLDISRVETINGVQYNYGDIRKIIAFPQQSGSLTIDPMEGECIARVRVQRKRNPNDPFDVFNDPFFNDPFFGRGVRDVKIALTSTPIKITVKDLPAGAPASFKGMVGKFSFEAKLDKDVTNTNEAVALRIKLNGKGNIKLFDAPPLDIPPGIESYEPKQNDNINVNANGVSGSRLYEYLLIPRNEGQYEIPAVELSYFDLEKKAYQTFTSPAFKLKVNKGTGSSSVSVALSPSKSEVQLLGKDIRFIKTGPVAFIRMDESAGTDFTWWMMVLIPVVLIILLLIMKNRIEAMNADAVLMRSRKAASIAKKKLSAAKKHLDKNEHEQFYTEVTRALWEFTGGKLNILPSALSKETATEEMKKRMVPEEIIKQFNNTIDACEMSRYAGGYTTQSSAAVYADAVNIISVLQEKLKR
ncbi:MAG: protein BatD [Bacteroidia bacterium]|nr:protein BatD [Bacteroidia bacterium]